MEDVLKFQRIQGGVESVFSQSKVTTAAIETNYLVIGLENGEIHIVSFAGQKLHKFRTHQSPVNCISLYFDTSLHILSCSNDGQAVLILFSQEETKEAILTVGEPVTAVAIEVGAMPSNRRDRSFLLGTEKGRLIYHKSAWFSQKDAILFPGDGVPVTSIAWKGNFAAWADFCVVRIMDVSTQTAICQLQPPYGVGVDDPFPCSLFWRSDYEIMIGWADICKVIRIEDGADNHTTSSSKVARTVLSWQTDCIICGLFPLDEEHVVYLGYSPPEEGDTSDFDHHLDESVDSSIQRNITNEPEIIIAKCTTGEIISADTLPLKGINLKGPFAYCLLSSYQCHDNLLDANKWKLKNYQQTRGGDRGNAPLIFILSSEDIVVARIRDVNDRVGVALEQKNLKLAVEIANDDRNSFKLYPYADLLNKYLTHLFDRNLMQDVAKECARLIGNDLQLWEKWIQRFIEHRSLLTLCPHLPTESDRRLQTSAYERILSELLSTQPRYFLEVIKIWSKVKPPLFDRAQMMDRLQSLTSARQLHVYDENDAEDELFMEDAEGGKDSSRPVERSSFHQTRKSYYLAALAHLYLLCNQHERALNAYLQMNINTSTATASSPSVREDNASARNAGVMSEYRQIFELIEKQSLFSAIENKIINLIQISKELSGKLLINNVDKLPIKLVANQLSVDSRLLHWYLHLVFSDPVTRDIYADPEEFAELHKKQTKLYAEFAPSSALHSPLEVTKASAAAASSPSLSLSSSATGSYAPTKGNSLNNPTSAVATNKEITEVRSSDAIAQRKKIFETDFITFIKSGLVDLNFCLQECQLHSPSPLYAEMIFIYSVRGERRKALNLLLREIGDISLAIDVIEDQFDSIMLVEGGFRRQGTRYATAPMQQQSMAYQHPSALQESVVNNEELWSDLIHFALDRPEFLPDLFDNLGVSRLDSDRVLRSVKPHTQIPLLRKRMVRMFRELIFKVDLFRSSKDILADDALNLLRQKNHGQRKAVKIDSKQVRCSGCLRLLSMDPGPLSSSQLTSLLPSEKNQILIWGSKGRSIAGTSSNAVNQKVSSRFTHHHNAHDTGAIIFSNKVAFHRICFEKIPSS